MSCRCLAFREAYFTLNPYGSTGAKSFADLDLISRRVRDCAVRYCVILIRFQKIEDTKKVFRSHTLRDRHYKGQLGTNDNLENNAQQTTN